MPARDAVAGRLIPVQCLRPGDHAFVGYGDDEVRWETVTAFVRLGLARGERVLVLPCPDVPTEEVWARIDFPNRSTVRARERGQLVVSSMRELIRPDTEFTAARQIGRLRAATDRATADGYTGLRAFVDMGWVAALGTEAAAVTRRETGARALFAGRPYTELCAYDRRQFAPAVLAAMERAHPRAVLERLGSLATVHEPGEVLCFVGEADTANQAVFTRSLELALARTAAARRLTVDLTRLHFLSVGCAVELLVLARDATGHELVEVVCGRGQHRLLRRLGAGMVPRLAPREPGCGGAATDPEPAASGGARAPAEESGRRLLQRRFTARLLPQLRLLVEECAAREGLREPRRAEFVLAVDEIAGNAVAHAGGSGRLVLRQVGDELECRIGDAGPGFVETVIPEPLPGLDGAPRGRGLWLARQVADRFAVAPGTGPAGRRGAVVTVAVRLR